MSTSRIHRTSFLCGIVAAVALTTSSASSQGGNSPARGLAADGFESEDAADRGAIEAYLHSGRATVDDDGLLAPGDLEGVPERMRRDIEERLERENALRRERIDQTARSRATPTEEPSLEVTPDDADVADEIPEFDDDAPDLDPEPAWDDDAVEWGDYVPR